jgi:membrane associated rhomboid family serine protease
MFLPIGDEPNPRGVPVVNYALILANVAVYLLVSLPLSSQTPDPQDPTLAAYIRAISDVVQDPAALRALEARVTQYDLLVWRWGYRPPDPSLLTAFTSMFLHAGFMHLAGNMLFLWIYGDNVEARLGPLGYLVSYLGTGLVAVAGHHLLSRGSPLPTVGASGAISGALGFYFLFFPRNRVRVLLAFFPFYLNVVHLPARWVLGFYLVVDNILPYLVRSGGGVAHGAHIGGFVGGLALAAWCRARGPGGPWCGVEAPEAGIDDEGTPPDTAGEAITRWVRTGEMSRAASAYLRLLREGHQGVPDPAVAVLLGDWLASQGGARAALSVYGSALRNGAGGEVLARARLGAGLVMLDQLHQPALAFQDLEAARLASRDAVTVARAQEALARIRALQKLTFRGQ